MSDLLHILSWAYIFPFKSWHARLKITVWTIKHTCRDASRADDDAHRNVTRDCRHWRSGGAQRRIIHVEREPQSAAGHNNVGEGQPSLEKNMSQPPLEMVERQNAWIEEGPKVEDMDIFENGWRDGKEPSLGFGGIGCSGKRVEKNLLLQYWMKRSPKERILDWL